jgi:hypothetical protein
MNPFRFSWTALLFILLAAAANAGDKSNSPRLELKLSELKPSSLFPGAKAYSATLTNTTAQPIPIEVLQLPPGYSGGGIFYACSVQFWNAKTKQWWTLPPGNKRSAHSGSGAQFLHSEIKPKETIEVCRDLLMKERIKGGRCARFAFTFHWDHKPDILSKPFVISDPEKPTKPIQCP